MMKNLLREVSTVVVFYYSLHFYFLGFRPRVMQVCVFVTEECDCTQPAFFFFSFFALRLEICGPELECALSLFQPSATASHVSTVASP